MPSILSRMESVDLAIPRLKPPLDFVLMITNPISAYSCSGIHACLFSIESDPTILQCRFVLRKALQLGECIEEHERVQVDVGLATLQESDIVRSGYLPDPVLLGLLDLATRRNFRSSLCEYECIRAPPL
jgi:hypothetical protein